MAVVVDILQGGGNTQLTHILEERLHTEFKLRTIPQLALNIEDIEQTEQTEVTKLKKLYDKLQKNLKYVTLYNSVVVENKEKLPLGSSSSSSSNELNIENIYTILESFIKHVSEEKEEKEKKEEEEKEKEEEEEEGDVGPNVLSDNEKKVLERFKFKTPIKSFEYKIDEEKKDDLKLYEIAGNGDCFYNAVLASYYLHTGDTKLTEQQWGVIDQQKLRATVAKMMEDQWGKYTADDKKAILLSEDGDLREATKEDLSVKFNTLIDGIKTTEWADNKIYRYIMDIFKSKIVVYTISDTPDEPVVGVLTPLAANDTALADEFIKISYNGKNHYNALGPKK